MPILSTAGLPAVVGTGAAAGAAVGAVVGCAAVVGACVGAAAGGWVGLAAGACVGGAWVGAGWAAGGFVEQPSSTATVPSRSPTPTLRLARPSAPQPAFIGRLLMRFCG